MSRKTQIDYTFQEAKDAATSTIATLAKFVENIDTLQPNSGLLQWAIGLRTLEERIRQASVRCLSKTEIKLIWGFAQMIIQARPELSNQLRHLWDLFDEIIKSYSVTSISKPLEPQEWISKLSMRIDMADRLAEIIVGSAKQRIFDILAPLSLLGGVQLSAMVL